MKTNYKFWYITREDDVHISECAIRFYEGDDMQVDVPVDDTDPNNKTTKKEIRYVKTKRLQKADLPHFVGRKVKKEKSGDDCIVYTSDDFGVITDNDELRVFLNKELKKDKGRIPEDTQVEEDLVKLKKLKVK